MESAETVTETGGLDAWERGEMGDGNRCEGDLLGG